ncbi:hypothetical protein HHSLTHF2_24510 [Vreelandella venusta]|uniref:Cytochrome c domain-containing protein n=1 Tax=Halomonas hydrothermalis TaxID=115561 RepID=A0A6F8U5Y8_9GAMM|nr:c-type cytochrome [Halomonas hydrothermalis]BCB08561.1 hypothetical protein HHSLTHF2_24510 [Halomonas hydrothermalis]
MNKKPWGKFSLLMGASLIGASALAGTAFAETGDAERGQAVAATCTACHQANGSGMNIPGGESWPRLAGLNADYMALRRWVWNSPPELGQDMTSTWTGGTTWTARRF